MIRFLSALVALSSNLSASAAEPAQAPDKAAAAAASSTKPDDDGETAVARVPQGYKAKVLDGETVYCRKGTPLGTGFPTEVCMTVAQYEESVRQRDRNSPTARRVSIFHPNPAAEAEQIAAGYQPAATGSKTTKVSAAFFVEGYREQLDRAQQLRATCDSRVFHHSSGSGLDAEVRLLFHAPAHQEGAVDRHRNRRRLMSIPAPSPHAQA